MDQAPLLRVTRLDALIVNEDETVTGTFLTEFGEVIEATFTIDQNGRVQHQDPEDWFMSWNGDAESLRSVVFAAASLLRAHRLSPLPDPS